MRMIEIVDKLNHASEMYHKYDNPIMTDKEYDELYAELIELELKVGIVMSNSPTHKREGKLLESLPVVKHPKLMLSCDKTKDINIIKAFCAKKDTYASWKLDGLTLVLTYDKGILISAVTRGNGEYGEDVTSQAVFIQNIPLRIPHKEELVVRGECVISWSNFHKINESLNDTERCKHPRNLAAGTIRQLNTRIIKERKIDFIAFECVTDFGNELKYEDFAYLDMLGFTVVPWCCREVDFIINEFTPEKYDYPVDGIVFEYASNKYSKMVGSTTKYDNCRIALKWKDEVYETILRDIVWNTSRTGLINPVAVFDPVDLDGATTTRASLYNISIIEKLGLGSGDKITVYRANRIIPQIHENLTKSNTYEIPEKCPICGSDTYIQEYCGIRTLHCSNKDRCKGKVISQIEHFANRDGMNIEGLGESIIERFVDIGIINNIDDIYNMELWEKNKPLIISMHGFGIISYRNLISAIEKSRNTTLTQFLTALGIPYTGKAVCKKISQSCNSDINNLINKYYTLYDWSKIKGVGCTAKCAINEYIGDNIDMIERMAKKLVFTEEEHTIGDYGDKRLAGLTFAATGDLNKIRRGDLFKLIQSMSGCVTKKIVPQKSVSAYLICNAISNSQKYRKAKEYGWNIMTEEEFFKMVIDKEKL